MCGIFGIHFRNSDMIPEKDRLCRTLKLLEHRGPDGSGVYAEPGIGLVHARLSLLDLSSRSDQPFWDGQDRFCIVYNGEVYNFSQLRAELEQRGVVFRTTSDTEVVLECVIHLGLEETLKRLEGMFAFALYDKEQKQLVLARDRFGIKPLYVYDSEDCFIFSSEVRAMRPWIDLKPDMLTISSYIQGFGGPTQGHSFFDNITIVPPGSVIILKLNEPANYDRFFTVSDLRDQDQVEKLERMNPNKIVDEVDRLLLDSVKKQLVADVPVGALCSGGVDSSLIMAMASKFHSNLAIFHANVVGPDSEYEAANALAKHLKLDLKSIDVTPQDFIDLIPDVIEHYGYPYRQHPNSIPFLRVSQLVRTNNIKAVLSGEGSDECYLGYHNLIFNLRKFLLEFPQHSFYQMVRQTARKLLGRWTPKPVYENASCNIFNGFEKGIERERIVNDIKQMTGRDIDEKDQTSLLMLNYHLRTLLHRNDCLGMASSIEARFPFLDTELVKFAVNMPYRCKVRFSPFMLERQHYFLRDKWVIRKVADRYLPAKISRRKKMGFPTETQKLLKTSPGFFKGSFVADIFRLDGNRVNYMLNNSQQQFGYRLLLLEVWAQLFLMNTSKDIISESLSKNVSIPDSSQR